MRAALLRSRSVDTSAAIDMIQTAAARALGLEALILFGSRARGAATARSDWDLGYLAGAGFDPGALLGALVLGLGTERVDLVDLRTASGLLRYRAARDGRLVWGDEGVHLRFRLEAIDFWCDVEPVLRPAYDAMLARR